MSRARDLSEGVIALPVWDTHTHLVGGSLAAQNFWDLGHYFWFFRELRAAGYPSEAEQLPEDLRFTAFLEGFNATRNTSMNWVVRRIAEDLYGIPITDVQSLARLDAAVRETAEDDGWPALVCERLGIQRLVTNVVSDAPFPELPSACRVVPRCESQVETWQKAIREAADQRAAAEQVWDQVGDYLAIQAAAGYRGVMTSDRVFGRLRERTLEAPPRLSATGNDPDALNRWLLHALTGQAGEHGLFLQLLMGVETWPGGAVPANDPDRVQKLFGLFSAYDTDVELVIGAPLNNVDAVQAGRVFSTVHVGGMWWYNFRASTYRETMQQRFESLPPSKCALVVSDARCIEWCYGKILLIKRLLVEFLQSQVDRGWLEPEDALRVASEWLYGAAARMAGEA